MIEKVIYEERSMVRRIWSQYDASAEIREWREQRTTVTHQCLPMLIADEALPDTMTEEWVEGEDLVSFLNHSAPLDDLQVSGIILQLLDVARLASRTSGKEFSLTSEDIVARQLEQGPVSITWIGWRPHTSTAGSIDDLPTFLLKCLYRAQFGEEFDTVESDLEGRFNTETPPNSLRREFVNLLLQNSNPTSTEALIEQFENRFAQYDRKRIQSDAALSQKEAQLSTIANLRGQLREARIRESYLVDWIDSHEQSRAHAEKKLERSHRQLAHSQNKLHYLNKRTLKVQNADPEESSEWRPEVTGAIDAYESNDTQKQESTTASSRANTPESIEPVSPSVMTQSVQLKESVSKARRWTHPQTLFAVTLVIVGATILGIWVAWSVIIKVESSTPPMPAPSMIGAPR